MRDAVKRLARRYASYAMTQTEKTLRCVECQRTIRENQARAAGWFYRSDSEDLRLVCSLCAAREFSAEAPSSTEA